MAGRFLGQPALPIGIADPLPFGMPAFEIAGDHPRPRLHHLADRATAFLRFAQTTAKLI